ncbi:MAG: hypothetical protein ACI4R7_02065 [Oliverpabstia sp.]
MKIFKDTGYMEQSAHFGWQDKDQALYGLREGYKSSADELVAIAINNGNNPKILDTFIFPVLFLYRHSIEISLKHIYRRARGEMPIGGHNLITLWDNVKKEIIDEMICSEEFIEQVKGYKENFIRYSLEGIKLSEIRSMLKELQEANQQDIEINPSIKQVDQNAEVWRYLISSDDSLFFVSGHSIDYLVLKESINYIYEVLDFIYHIVDEYLSS